MLKDVPSIEVPVSQLREIYTSGLYLEKNPGWHLEEAPWKAKQIMSMLNKHGLSPQMVCEVGCGVGGVLKQLQERSAETCEFWGYDISPQAIALAEMFQNERLYFRQADILQEAVPPFDLVLLMDVLEHLEDLQSFLRRLKLKGEYKLFHVSLMISVQTVVRKNGFAHVREKYGMVNYFTRDTLLQALRDAGYEIIDHCYTTSSTDLPTHVVRKRLMRLPRKILFALNRDLAACLLGGYRCLVLAR
ncbi:MAG: class I SAM-dependent methyltransferase [Ktedonobacteraceae bacterium]|nr:class I SAM-dependent methyltransferase [Ktedonobacteraceae bacterium]